MADRLLAQDAEFRPKSILEQDIPPTRSLAIEVSATYAYYLCALRFELDKLTENRIMMIHATAAEG